MNACAQQQDLVAWLQHGERGASLASFDAARIGVHRNTYLATLVEALAESFPVTRALAGADFFDAMARERVLAEPPRSPVLTDYAVSFPGFVFDFEPARSTPVLAEMAQLEAMRLRAFHAADGGRVGLHEFHRLACDDSLLSRTRACLHPAAQWLPARHPVLELWQAHDEATDPAAVNLGGIDAGLAQDVLVHRPAYVLRMRALPPGAIAFLDALACGGTFTVAFSEACAVCPFAEPAALFSLLLQEALVSELIELAQEPA